MLIMIDLDNTLVDRAGAVDEWAAGFVAERELGPDNAIWIRNLDNDGYSNRHDVFKAIKVQFGLMDTVDELVSDYQNKIVKLIRAVPGARACLDEMRSLGWQVIIVTNGSTKQQNAKIDRLGLRSSVDEVVVSQTLGIKKPDPGIFEHAASLCGADLATASEGTCWMVGDSPLHDIQGGRAVGMSTAWIPRRRPWPANQPGPTLIVDDLGDLPAQLVAAQ